MLSSAPIEEETEAGGRLCFPDGLSAPYKPSRG